MEELTAKTFQALVQSLDVTLVDVRDICHEIRNITTGVTHLLNDVVITKDAINLPEDTWTVGVDEDDADVVLLRGGEGPQRYFGHVDGAGRAAAVDVADQRISHLDSNGSLGFFGAAADVRCHDQVLERAQVLGPAVERGVEVVAVGRRLRRVNIEGRSGNVA